jgi:putative hydrolase of the HAD superfamily
MIRAVIFDFGNVLCRFDNRRIVENLAPYSDLTPEELSARVLTPSALGTRYESGLITSGAFFESAKALCRLRITRVEFVRAFCGIFTPIPETEALVKRLHGHVKLGLLSNTSEWHYLHAIRAVEVFPLFDAVTVSFEVKALKPDAAVYRDMLEKLELAPEECFYTDDILPFVEAARELGMHAAPFTTPDALEGDLMRHEVSF